MYMCCMDGNIPSIASKPQRFQSTAHLNISFYVQQRDAGQQVTFIIVMQCWHIPSNTTTFKFVSERFEIGSAVTCEKLEVIIFNLLLNTTL